MHVRQQYKHPSIEGMLSRPKKTSIDIERLYKLYLNQM